jgi:hypothetical protein
MSLNELAFAKIREAQKNVDKREQIQSLIREDVNLYKNSINLFVGKRSSSKTENIFIELIKIDLLPGHVGFTAFVIVSDKQNDSTVNEFLPLIHMKIIQVDYDHAEGVLSDIAEGKTAYERVVSKDLENELTEESKEDILSKTSDDDFYQELPHTFILLDDAINVLTQRKYRKLQQMLFRNRQPRFTICICVQDLTGVPPQIRRNLDSLWLLVEMCPDRTSCTCSTSRIPM